MKQRTGGPRGAAGVEALVQLLRYASTLIAQDQEERTAGRAAEGLLWGASAHVCHHYAPASAVVGEMKEEL